MLHRAIFNIARRTICTNTQIFYVLKNTAKLNSNRCSLRINSSYPQQNLNSIIFKRFKSKGKASKKSKYDEEDDEDKDDDDDDDDDDDVDVDDYLNTEKSKIIRIAVPSLRMDVIAKAGFGISRAKLDKEFYNGNLCLNGQKCLKKSIFVKVGDELDHIQRRSPTNSDLLIINRCVLLSVVADPEKEAIKVKIIQNKSLLIENYREEAWKQND